MKYLPLLLLLLAFSANASDAPKAGDKKKERSEVPEKIPRPKASPDALPQHVEKSSNGESCTKFEYKESGKKVVCLIPATGPAKPKSGGH
jgi:hypothetical protein